MYRLPDVIQLGTFPLNTSILMVALGGALFQWWLSRRAAQAGYDAGLASDISASCILYALLGAKGLEALLGLPSYLAAPGLLLALPTGWQAWAGALLGTGACLAWFRHRQQADLVRLVDLAALPALVALGVGMLGRPVPHATVVGVGLLVAALALVRLARHAAFAGHQALAAVVLGALALTVTHLFGPGGARLFGIPRLQVGAVVVGLVAYLIAVRLERRAAGEPEAER